MPAASLPRRAILGATVAGLLRPGAGFAITQPELSPYDFGAKGDGSDDTAALNRAVREAVRSRRPLTLPRGDFRVAPPAQRAWNWRNQPDRPVHVCVELLSGLTLNGNGGRLMTSPPAGPIEQNARILLFGTGLNPQPGALRDITIEDIEVDFADRWGRLHPLTYAFGLTGTDNFRQKNLLLRSTGQRAGRGLLFENGRGRRQEGCRHYNMIQGHYIRYEHSPTLRDIAFEQLTECMDWDGPCWGVDAQGLRFKDLMNEAQCIDTAGGADWNVRDITAENTGSIFFVYSKGETVPSYADWLNTVQRSAHANLVIAERMRFANIRGRRIGVRQRTESFRISNYRNNRYPAEQNGVSPSRDITVEDMVIDGGFGSAVNECHNLQMRRVTLRDMRVRDENERGAALYLRQSTANPNTTRDSELSGVVSDLTIERSQGIGLAVTAPSDLTLTNIRVEGYNLQNSASTRAGIEIRDLGRRPGSLRMENVQVSGGVGTDLTDIAVIDPPPAMEARRIVMSGVRGSTPGAAMALPRR